MPRNRVRDMSQQPSCLRICSLLAVAILVGCNSPVSVDQIISVEDITTGWLDRGIDNFGRNKLVPTVSFRLANHSTESVRTLQLMSSFRRCFTEGQTDTIPEDLPPDSLSGTCAGEMQEWGSAYLRAVGREGLASGAATERFTMDSGRGYPGEQSRLDMLMHRLFVEVKVELFVRRGSDQWVTLGEHSIDRQLLTR